MQQPKMKQPSPNTAMIAATLLLVVFLSAIAWHLYLEYWVYGNRVFSARQKLQVFWRPWLIELSVAILFQFLSYMKRKYVPAVVIALLFLTICISLSACKAHQYSGKYQQPKSQ